MSETPDKVKFSLSLQEVFVMGSAIVTITASFLWLRADLLVLTTKFETVKDNVKRVEEEQTKMKTTIDSIYSEIRRSHNSNHTNHNGEFLQDQSQGTIKK